MQMCHVLQYLCDCQVRHRIEAVVAFSDDFVACLQDSQRFRYNEVMLALNMSAALTAKKTKEFRSPPQEQRTETGRFIELTSKTSDRPSRKSPLRSQVTLQQAGGGG
ncbi:hypothetical protein OJAV_G00017390 [Oryzias javanicus]|uniref:Ryanodine receptor junctional solenoid domain-containing protein n=1 Tax=Oryzias javanicus TaxID=123683 RepID=A0A3S2PGX4_ORYJA|nr:hypothetical protein OJAV_G00017390 [Oryzias javanicus]